MLKYEPKGEWKLEWQMGSSPMSWASACFVCVRLLWISVTQDHFHRGVLWFHEQGKHTLLHTHIQWHTKRSIYVQHSYYINPINFVNPNILFLNHQQTYSVQTKSIHSQISNSLLNMTDYNLYNTNADSVSSQILLQERRWSPISKKPSDRRPPALLSDLNVSL